MKILLTGKDGQVGHELERRLALLGDVTACDRARLDLAKADDIVAAMRGIKPDVVVNAAAYTAVDKAESEPELARAINGRAPGIFAEEARKLGALLVHYSTDYVFDGTKANPYSETDPTAPVNTYGASKLEGELAIAAADCRFLVLRTSWVYGPHGRNFLKTILKLAADRTSLRIVDDQIGAPTTSMLIAETSAALLSQHPDANGLFHLCATGFTSWYGFAKAGLAGAGMAREVTPISSSEYPTPARRPKNSRLDTSLLRKTFGIDPPPWENGLAQTLAALQS